MTTPRLVRSICVFTVWISGLPGAEAVTSPFAAAEAAFHQDSPKAAILALDEDATLRPCQRFHWRAVPGAKRYWLGVGSYPQGADVFNEDVSGRLSALVKLPADGRPIYLTLFTELDGVWRKAEYRFRAPGEGAPEACEALFPDRVGIYHWAGLGARSVVEGVDRIRQIGSRAVRITMSPRYYRDYNIGDACYENYSLPALLEEPDIAQALADPAIRVYMITAYDGTTFGDCYTPRFLNPRFYSKENQARIEEEYAAFTYRLHASYSGGGKQFLLSNWEGDNSVFCGEANRYAHDKRFQTWCDENYPLYHAGNASPAESIEGLRLWFTARWRGIQEGKRRAAADGYHSVSVFAAPEFSIVRSLRDNGHPSVLYDVIPNVPFDFVSYSAYESINRPDAARELQADLDAIRKAAGADTVVLGEIGFSRSAWGAAVVERTSAVIDAAREWGVSYVFQWALYDHSPEVNFGLSDSIGADTPLADFYRTRYASVASGREEGTSGL